MNRLSLRMAGLMVGMALLHTGSRAGAAIISATTFEQDPPGQPKWVVPYHYAWGVDASGCVEVTDPWHMDDQIGVTNGPTVLRLGFDAGTIGQAITNAPEAGYGAGFEAALNWAGEGWRFASGNLGDYYLDFDLRVEGLLAGVTSAPVRVQFALYASDGTVTPPDGTPDQLTQLSWELAAGSNWSHYGLWVGNGLLTGGSSTLFEQYRLKIADLRFNCSVHLPGSTFGYDGNNALLVDNVRLQLACLGPPPPPQVGLAVAAWDFDKKSFTNEVYGYCWVPNGPLPVVSWPTTTAQMTGYGVGGSNGMWLRFDNSALAPPNTPPWAGARLSGSGPVDLGRFDTGDLGAYRVSFDARAQGLAAGRSNTICALELFFELIGADLALRFEVPAESNWVRTVWSLKEGVVWVGSKASFATNFNRYTGLQTRWDIPNVSSGSDWDFDSNNIVVIDNFRLERLYVGCPPLDLRMSNGLAVVNWDAAAVGNLCRLESAPALDGLWQEVTNAAAPPYMVPMTNAARYFRTQYAPPPVSCR